MAISALNFLSLVVALAVAEPAPGHELEPEQPKSTSVWTPLRTLLTDRFVLACSLVVPTRRPGSKAGFQWKLFLLKISGS